MPDGDSKLAVLRLSWAGIRMPFERFGDFVWMAWFPLSVAMVSLIVFGGISWATDVSAIRLLYLVTFMIVAIPFKVGWYRLIVIGNDGVAGRPYFVFSNREIGYLIAALIIDFACYGPFGIALGYLLMNRHSIAPALFWLGCMGAFALLIPGFAILVRAIFILPAIAVGRLSSVRTVWRQTKGYGSGILGIWLVTTIPFAVPGLIFSRFRRDNTGVAHAVILGAIVLVVGYFQSAARIGAMGLAYREKVGPPSN